MTAEQSGWRSSNALFVVVALVAPFLAIPLVLARPERRATKLLGCALLLVLTGFYVNTASKVLRQSDPATASPVSRASSAVHWRLLEAQREAQARQASPEGARLSGRYWTGFRGPGTAGHYDETKVLDEWPSQGLPLLWKQPIGEGWGSFAIADGVAFTIERRRDEEVVAAYRLDSGRELWTASWKSRFSEASDRDGPRATPLWDQGRVYALGAAGDLVALEAATGKELWRRDILEENGAGNIRWGVSASPAVAGDVLVTLPGGSDGRAVVAYDKVTGEPRWKALSDNASYTTPMFVTLAGRQQVLVVTATRAVGLDPADGKVLWEHPWPTDMGVNAAQPIVTGGNRFMLSAGYGHGAALVEIAREGDAMTARAVWETTRLKNKLSSSVYHEGHLYGLDEGILACLDAETGEQRWKDGRYGHGQLVLAQGFLIVLTEDGELALVDAKPDAFVERARFTALDGRTWNNPAVASGVLLVRNGRQMAAYRLSPV